MAISPNLSLSLYDTASGSATTFLDFRLALAGYSSNMTLIDDYAGTTSASIIALKANNFYVVPFSEYSSNYYLATIGNITSYYVNMVIIGKFDTSISGSTVVNINSLGDQQLQKIGGSGLPIDLVSGDIIANNYYLFVYNGTYFIVLASGSSSGSSLSNEYYVTTGSSSSLTNYRIITAGSNISLDNTNGSIIIHSTATSGSSYSGSAPINVAGSVISHATSGVSSGSYNKVEVDTRGHVVSGSIVGYQEISSISGSGIMSTSTGSVVKHNASAVTSGSYLAANIVIDAYGHITSAENGVSASSVGAPSDSPFVTTGSSSNLTNYSKITAGSNISLENTGGSLIMHSAPISGSSVVVGLTSPPTEAEITSAFGSPASVGTDKIFFLIKSGSSDYEYLCVSDGTTWQFMIMTKAV